MAIKKSEIYSELWKSCDQLRGGMDASQYKDYILAILFVKYISDKYSGKTDSTITIPKGASFQDIVSLKWKKEIGSKINEILKKLSTEIGLKGIFNKVDFDDPEKLGSGKAKIDRLSKIIAIFENNALDFSKNRADGDDILGDAYEFLMKKFATQSGKSKGSFFTPSEVSKIIAKVIGANNTKRPDWSVYDPTAGSGSLLLKVSAETPNGITIYGQERDVATTAMAKMNMWIHKNEDADIRQENTLSDPFFKNKDGSLKTFDFVVSNPPFSDKSWSNGFDENNDKFKRFEGYGIPPNKNGDYAFLLHVIKSLKNSGKGAIILPHGVLFRGNAEAEIRKNLIERGFIKGVIGLPPNLFYGTPIPACIIVLDKENAESRKEIFMINANKGFIKDGNKSRLQAKDIQKIVDSFTKELEMSKFSRMVPISEISNELNDYSLNITKYVDNQEEEDIQDVEAHLKGGIPKKSIDELEKYWNVYPNIKKTLFSLTKVNYLTVNVEKSKIQSTIFEHDEFKNYSKNFEKIFIQWRKNNLSILNELKIGIDPKKLISTISNNILEEYSKLTLINKYDIFQHLMTYWENIMQDDVFLISQNGWNVSFIEKENKKGKSIGWDSELIPKDITINKYFTKEKKSLENIHTELEKVIVQIQALDEEYQGEDDIFSDVRNEVGNIDNAEIKKRLKIIESDSGYIDEFRLLTKYHTLKNSESELKKKIKLIEQDLDKKLYTKYNNFSEFEIKDLVIEHKWISEISYSINEEMDKVSHKLSRRIYELVERYESPLPKLITTTQSSTKKVDNHLRKMGFTWETK